MSYCWGWVKVKKNNHNPPTLTHTTAPLGCLYCTGLSNLLTSLNTQAYGLLYLVIMSPSSSSGIWCLSKFDLRSLSVNGPITSVNLQVPTITPEPFCINPISSPTLEVREPRISQVLEPSSILLSHCLWMMSACMGER